MTGHETKGNGRATQKLRFTTAKPLDPNPHRRQRLVRMDLPRRADVVPGPFDGQVDVFGETDADAGVDLGPVPPDARGRILSAVAFESVVQLAPAHGRLNAL